MDIKIFGCRFNKYYAQKWLKKLGDKENSILVASCAVTDNAKKKFIKEVKQQIKAWKHVFLTGCGAFLKNWQIDTAWFYTAYPSLLECKDKITLLPENPKIQKILEDKTRWYQKINNKKISLDSCFNISLYTKGFVIVQLGCDSYCSFCITVKKRWHHKNKDVKEVIEEINKLEKQWVKEVVLTGINLAAWWMPNTNTWSNPYFPKYLEEILKFTSIPRIRISSIWPEFIDDSRFEILENERILPYFHLSIQSGSDKILNKMKRHYNLQHIEYVIENLLKLNKQVPVNIWADIIVGFPGETEEDFQQTYNLCKKYISKLHVFPFSSHQIWDTVPAGKFENQIPLNIKKQREQQLIEVCEQNHKKLEEKTKWKKVKVLIEENNSGWTENYLKYTSKRNLSKWEIYEFIF